MRRRDAGAYDEHLSALRSQLMTPLSAASMELGSYHRGYEHIVRLHMLTELEEGVRCLLQFPSAGHTTDLPSLLHCWQQRSLLLQNSYRAVDPVLSLRRVILSLAADTDATAVSPHIDQLWLQAARTARK